MRLFAILLLTFTLGSFGTVHGSEFVIAANPQAPFKFEDQGHAKGIDVEVVRTVLEELGVKHVFRFIKADERLLREAKSGRIDMLLLYSKKPAREKFLIYPKESYVSLDWHFFYLKERRKKFLFNEFSDLKGHTIGVTRGVSYPKELTESGLTLDYAASTEIQLKKLVGKRVDLAPMSTQITLYGLSNAQRKQVSYLPKPLKSKPYYNVFSKASAHPDRDKIVKAYDRIMKVMKSDGRLLEIYRRYLGKEYQPQF